MQTRVQKWGNGLGLPILRGLAEEVGPVAGTEVSLSAKDGELVVKPALPSRLSPDVLLVGLSESNIHNMATHRTRHRRSRVPSGLLCLQIIAAR